MSTLSAPSSSGNGAADQLYARLDSTYMSLHKVLEKAPDKIAKAKTAVDDLYNNQQIGKSSLSVEFLQQQRGRYEKVFSTYTAKCGSAMNLCSDLEKGIQFYNPPTFTADTIQSLHQRNPTHTMKLLEDGDLCKERVQTLKNYLPKVSKFHADLGDSLAHYGESLKYFCALVDNGGNPLGYLTLGQLRFQTYQPTGQISAPNGKHQESEFTVKRFQSLKIQYHKKFQKSDLKVVEEKEKPKEPISSNSPEKISSTLDQVD